MTLSKTSLRLFAASSLALRYPSEVWLKPLTKINVEEFSKPTRETFQSLLLHFTESSLLKLQMDYVDVFDRKNRTSLNLSYFANGDTRARGMALLRFKQTYSIEGWHIDCDELPDYLPIVLEFIAVTGSSRGFNLLREHRSSVALLEIALRNMNSIYAPLIREILTVIPGDSSAQTLKFIEKGPPVEFVGLPTYGGRTS